MTAVEGGRWGSRSSFRAPIRAWLPGARGIDTGVDPSAILPGWILDLSFDGTSRVGRAIDRGAFEQGQ